MKSKPCIVFGLVSTLFFLTIALTQDQDLEPQQGALPQAPLGTGFTYQGQLVLNGTPVSNTCDLHFSLWNASSGGAQLGTTQIASGVGISDGYFTVELNGGGQFGTSAFNGQMRWLGIVVRCGGGRFNWANNDYTTVAGGRDNFAGGIAGFVGGGDDNGAYGDYAAVSGGYDNDASGNYSTVGGGSGNQADNPYATVAGGLWNYAQANYATVSGGYDNEADAGYSTVAGGYINNATQNYAAIGGGYSNEATAASTTIGGGYNNTASNNAATVPGGADNTASGGYSFAAGAQATASHTGSFVWSSGEATQSWGDRTFTVRSHGGVRFYSASGTGTGVVLPGGGGAWSSLSDRAAKANLAPVDTHDILARLAAVPIQSWNYGTQDPSIRHIGPIAQDFYAAFGVGEDERYISTIDADGVALAAIQGLYAQNQELAAENNALQQRVGDLEARVAALEAVAASSAAAEPVAHTADLLPWIGVLLAGVGITGVFRQEGIHGKFGGGRA